MGVETVCLGIEIIYCLQTRMSMSVSACQHVHLCMDTQPCRHGRATMQTWTCSHAGMQTCRHGHAEMQTWTSRDPGMQTCRDGHAPREDKGVDMQTRKHGHAHVDSHGDMNMQTWTRKLADTLMRTCRTCRRGCAGMTCDLEVGMAGTHPDTQTRSRMHSDMAMQTWMSCRDAAMEKWI